ncbi:MAG: hypothetical protein H6523_15085 [Mycolicibacterium sp.]|nr:hypothetical protein [Mycolicibacterium sp.]
MSGTELSIEEANQRVDQAEEVLNNVLKLMGDANDHLLSLQEQRAFLGQSGTHFQVGGQELYESGSRVANDGNNLLLNARHAAMTINEADSFN